MSKNLYKRNGIWWAEKVYQRKRFRFSLETSNFREAQRRLAEKIEELTATHWGEKPRRTFAEIVDRFVEDHLPNLKPRSQQRYLTSIVQLGKTFADVKLDEIRSGLLYEFELSRSLAGAAKPTIRSDLACLSSMLGIAKTMEWLEFNPVAGYLATRAKKGLKEAEPKTRYLDHDEERFLLSHADEGFGEAIAFAIDTGLRKEEQFSLMRHHVDLKRHEVIIDATISKTSKERRVPLLPRAQEIVRHRMLSTRSAYIFPAKDGSRYSGRSNYILKRLKAVAAKSGIKPVIWHDLRRTCGCRLLQDRNMAMEGVARWLGHSSVNVTEKSYAFLRVDDLHRTVGTATESESNIVPMHRA